MRAVTPRTPEQMVTVRAAYNRGVLRPLLAMACFPCALFTALVAGCAGAQPRDSGPATVAGEPGARPAKVEDNRRPATRPPRAVPEPAPADEADLADGADGETDPAEPVAAPALPAPPPGKAVAAKPAPSPPPRAPPPGGASARDRATEYVLRLQSGPEAAAAAYRELWEVPRELIPQLILKVTREEPSSLKELKVLVLDRERLARIDDGGGSFTYDIPGLRNVKYDDIVIGEAPRGAKVILRSLKKPFPVGVVLRTALLNRFQSADYPPSDDGRDPVRWWQKFHERVRARL
jgi:hypothetical protein